jgi:uncharacterized membrane protein
MKIARFINQYLIYLILLPAAALRLFQLDRRDFWYDEAFSGIAVKESWSGMMQMIKTDVHPPLYYLTLKFFALFFDYSVHGIRLYSVIFGLLCVWAVYLFSKELFGKKAALFASFIAATSPFAIQYSMEGRMYSMFSFFVIMAAYFLIRALREDKRYVYHLLFGLFLGLSALTHYMGIFFAPIFYLVYVINKFRAPGKTAVTGKQIWQTLKSILPDKNIFLGYVVALIVFAPWIPNFVSHIVKNSTSNSLDWIRPANIGDIPVNIQMFIFGTPLGEMSSGMPGSNEFYGIADISMWILLTIFLTAVIYYLLRNSNKSKEIGIILTLSVGFMALIWFLGFFGKYYFVARYLLAAGYFVFVLLGYWLSRIRLSYSGMTIAFYLVLLLSTIPLGYSEGWNVFAKDLSQYKKNDFYILNSFDYVIAKYYLGADRLTLYNVDWPPYNPDYWAAIGKSLKRTENFEDLRNDKNALIISNTQLGGQDNRNFNPIGLTLVAQYKNILIYKFQ